MRAGARVAVLGGLTAAGPLAIDTYLPSLPALAAELDASVSLTQVSLTVCVVGIAVGQLVAGPVSDVLGRRRPLLAGSAGFALASLACAFAPDITTFLVLRAAQGLLGSIGIVVARAVVRDLHDGPAMARVFAALLLVSGLAPILAPLLGGWLLTVTDWRGIFVVLAGLGAVVFVGVLVAVGESLPRERRRRGGATDTLASFRVLLGDRRVVACVLAVGFSCAALFAYIAGSSFVLQEIYGLSPQTFGAVFAADSVGIVGGAQLSGRLVGAGRARAERMLTTGLVVACAGTLGLLTAVLAGLGVVAVVAGLFVTVTGVGLTLPAATTLALAGHPDRAGGASALLGGGQFLVGGVVAPLVGLAGAGTAVPMAVVIVAVTVIGLAGFAVVWCSARRGPADGRLGSGA